MGDLPFGKLLFPEACWSKDLISGAVFPYFQDENILFPLHPSATTFLAQVDPFSFIHFVNERKPIWSDKFNKFLGLWRAYRESLEQTTKLIRPLHGVAYKTTVLSYPRDDTAWQASQDLLDASNIPKEIISQIVEPYSAADELFAHIFFEKALEIYGSPKKNTEDTALNHGSDREHEWSARNVDWRPLYEYCDGLFRNLELNQLLSVTYMFRVRGIGLIPSCLLSNPRLIDFLEALPIEEESESKDRWRDTSHDTVAWEFFRQLLSPRLDPLTPASVDTISSIVLNRRHEVDALKNKCLQLALELQSEPNISSQQEVVSEHIRLYVENEVQQLLDIDKASVQEFLDSVFSDEKTWLGVLGFVYSVFQGGPLLTAGAALYGVANLGSKAYKAAAERRNKLAVSGYALLYRVKD